MLASPVIGAQLPRISSWPDYVSSTGDEAIELAALAGIELDEWQKFVLRHSMGEKPNGDWASPEVAVLLSRQNGKGTLLEARVLAGLFLLGEQLIVWSAHLSDTSMEAWRRLRFHIENTPELSKRVKSFPGTHGQEGIELMTNQRVRFRTRTKGGGRGFSGDLVIFDEAMIFPESSHAAILPIISARPNPQVFYTGSAVDQSVHDAGVVFARVRKRGRAGGDPRLAYFEWSVDAATPADVPQEVAGSPEAWIEANPALGIRISPEYVRGELYALGPRNFAVERLGVGDWPDPDMQHETVIDMEAWGRLEDPHAQLADPVVFAFDVTPDRSSSAIAAAGVTGAGRPMVEVVRHDRGTGWVVPWILERVGSHKPLAVACDAAGAAASLLVELEQAGVDVFTFSAQDHARACGVLFDDAVEGRLTHLGQHNLTAAVRGATQRPLGGAWGWNRRAGTVDIAPLVACTLALGAYKSKIGEKPRTAPGVVNLADIELDDDEDDDF